jgi:hypothetical protein
MAPAGSLTAPASELGSVTSGNSTLPNIRKTPASSALGLGRMRVRTECAREGARTGFRGSARGVEDEGVVYERKGDGVEGAGDEEGRVASRYYVRSAKRRASGEGAGTQERRPRLRSCPGKRARDTLQSCSCVVELNVAAKRGVISRGKQMGYE